MNHFEYMVNMYHNAPINAFFKPTLTIESEGQTSITLDVISDHFHTGGFLHGSAIFKLLDDAAYFAAQSMEETLFLVTSSFNSHFIRPVNNGQLTAYGKIIETTNTQCIAESRIINDDDKLIAHGSGCFVKSSMALKDIETSKFTS